MKKNKSLSVYTVFKILFLTIVVIIIVFPLLHIVSVSFSGNVYILKNEISFYPKGFNIEMYKFVMKNKKIFEAYNKTIYYTITGTFLSLVVTAAGAYALSKKRMIYSKAFMIMILITMFFQGGMIPSYLLVRWLGMLDTTWAIILPTLVSAWHLIIMRSFFIAFPAEIEESGMIDGLNSIGIFWHLVLPVSKAVLATIALFSAVLLWNSYFIPFLYLETPSKFPLQIVLRGLLESGTTLDSSASSIGDSTIIAESLKYAAIVVSVVPVIAVYPFLQKYFTKGVMLGSIKG